MTRKELAVTKFLAVFGDLWIVSGSFFLGYAIRNRINDLYTLSSYIGLLPVMLTIWGCLLFYYSDRTSGFARERILSLAWVFAKMASIAFLLFGSFTYIFKITYISRTLIAFIFALSALFIGLEKAALLLWFRWSKRRQRYHSNLLVVGTGRRAQQFIERLDKHPEWGFNVVGLVDEDPGRTGQQIGGYRVLGSLNDVPEIVHRNVVDEAVFVVPRSWVNKIGDAMLFCENEGIQVAVAVDYFQLRFSNAMPSELGGFPLLTFKTTTDKVWHLLIKRAFDIVMSGITLLALSPLFALVGLLIKLTSDGPVFYRQVRCGLHGRRFMLYKFRTMVRDAEIHLRELLEHNEMAGPVFKMANDPRVTRLGGYLRRMSIDELPQLWNVFRGDMSIVGPRPPIPYEVERYDCWHRRRLSMKPGVTCLWQVNGRNKITDFNQWVKLDLEYIDNWSLWLECKILLKTVPVVLFGVGAK